MGAEEADTSAKFISHRGINSLKSCPFIQRTTTPDHLQKMGEREDNVYKAKLAEQAERYDEMVTAMKTVASKNVIGARRASWRIISSIEQKEENKAAEDKLKMIKTYRTQVEQELKDICNDILQV